MIINIYWIIIAIIIDIVIMMFIAITIYCIDIVV